MTCTIFISLLELAALYKASLESSSTPIVTHTHSYRGAFPWTFFGIHGDWQNSGEKMMDGSWFPRIGRRTERGWGAQRFIQVWQSGRWLLKSWIIWKLSVCPSFSEKHNLILSDSPSLLHSHWAYLFYTLTHTQEINSVHWRRICVLTNLNGDCLRTKGKSTLFHYLATVVFLQNIGS